MTVNTGVIVIFLLFVGFIIQTVDHRKQEFRDSDASAFRGADTPVKCDQGENRQYYLSKHYGGI